MDYFYPGTRVLKNKFDIQDVVRLEYVERRVSFARELSLDGLGITGRFDSDHLKGIHAFLFGDIYSWAGQFREEHIAKGLSHFVEPEEISDAVDNVCGNIGVVDDLKDLSRKDFVNIVTETFAGLNQSHPFREGNGRTQRAFLRQLSLSAGYVLDFRNVSENDMRNLSIFADRGDLRLMRLTVDGCLCEIPSEYVVPVNIGVKPEFVDFSEFKQSESSVVENERQKRDEAARRVAQLMRSPSGNVRDLSNWPDFGQSPSGRLDNEFNM